MSEAQAVPAPEATNGAAAPEADHEPEVVYRRPAGINASDEIRAALDGAEADTAAAADKPNGKPAEKPAELEQPPEPKPEQSKKTASQLHAEAYRRLTRAKTIESRAADQVKAAESKVQEYEAKLAELEALDEMAVLQRVAERRGLTLDQLVKRGIARVANKGALPPEEQQKAEIEAARKKADEAAAEVERMRKEREEEREGAKEHEAQATIDGWKSRAASLALANEDRLPLLTALSPETIAERAYDVMAKYYEYTKEAHGKGVVPSHEDVLLYLEQQEQADFDRKEERRRKLQTPPQETGDSAPGSGMPAQQTRPARTLTNRDAAERASSRKRPMSEQERIAYAAEAIPD